MARSNEMVVATPGEPAVDPSGPGAARLASGTFGR